MALLAEYGFDINGSGSITDLSGNGRTGTISGDTAWTSPGHDSNGCIYNPSSRADGSGVHIPRTGLEPSSALTVMCWVSSQETGDGYRNAVSKSRAGDSDSYSLYTSYPQLNRPAMTISTTAGFHQATAPTALLSGGGWHHLAGTYDGANLILYVDGTAITTVAATGTLAYTTTDLTILKSQAWPTYSATAKIDDVRIYDAALTGAEITALMGTPAGSGTVHQAAGLMAATSATSGTVAATYKAAGAAAATSSTKGAASIAGDLVIITPAARTYAVAAESRTYLVQQ